MKTPDNSLPRNVYNKGANLTTEEEAMVDSAMDTMPKFLTKTGESIEIDEKMMDEIEDLMDNHLEWIQDFLGLSTVQRRLDLNKIFIMDEENYRKNPSTEGDQGHSTYPSREIFALTMPDSRQVIRVISHEMIHLLARNSVLVERLGPTTRRLNGHLSGYANPRKRSLVYLNEMITETMNIEALNFQRKDDPDKDYITDVDMGYPSGVIFMDMAIQKIAEATEKTHEEVRRFLFTGYIKGETKNLNIFEKIFGPGTLKFLATIRTESDFRDLRILSDHILKLDTREFRDKITKYENGEEITLFSGIKITGKNHQTSLAKDRINDRT